MYRTYLRTYDQQVLKEFKTVTNSQIAAVDAFEELINRTDLDGKKIAAVLSYNNQQLAFHRFDKQQGHTDYWRDRIGEIKLPHPGKPATLNGGRAVKVYLDAQSIETADKLGNGNVSEGIRIALSTCSSQS